MWAICSGLAMAIPDMFIKLLKESERSWACFDVEF
jgi:hypothetical protein